MKATLKSGAVYAILISLALAGGQASAAEIKIGGTGTDLGTMRVLGNAFKKKNPDTTITVFPSLGSGGGIRALVGGAIDIAISSRPPKDKESKAGLKAFRYGTTALVIATAGKQSLPGLTSEKLIEIYAKRQTNGRMGKSSGWFSGH
jgi:phosphate transport system substrate-binding protein